jgi:uncharacterized membrane protein
MAQRMYADVQVHSALPQVRRIGLTDVRDALDEGIDDFSAMPSHVMFLGLIYAFIGLVLGKFTFGYNVLPLLFPLIAGFSLIGPVAATGLYELSRRREQGLDVNWARAFGVLRAPSIRRIAGLGALLLTFFVGWLYTAEAIYEALFSDLMPTSLAQFAQQVLTTPQGWVLIIVGNAVGFLFAMAVLILSVVSFPMLLDRNVSIGTAVQTSARVVSANPLPIAAWGLTVAIGLVLGSLPFLIGLAVVMPILGHATWHLYRKVVV